MTWLHPAPGLLAALDEDGEFTWAVGWFEALCELNGPKFTLRHRNAVAEAVERPLSPTRTMTELSAHVRDTDSAMPWSTSP
jgi:hypothetical protein